MNNKRTTDRFQNDLVIRDFEAVDKIQGYLLANGISPISKPAVIKHGAVRHEAIFKEITPFEPSDIWSVYHKSTALQQKAAIDWKRLSAERSYSDRHRNKFKPAAGHKVYSQYRRFRRRTQAGKSPRFEPFQQKASADEFCLVSVKKTKNNTHCSISRLFGDQKTLWTTSGGQTPTIGSKSNGRRKSRYCQRMIFKAATEKLLTLGLKYLVIHCIGRAISKRYIFRNFYRRFRIVLLKDLLAIPHNGCRPKKARRL